MRGRGGRGAGRGRGDASHANAIVEESVRIDMRRQLEQFQRSDRADLTLPSLLSADARDFARTEAEKLGLKASSKGQQLCVAKYRASDRGAAALHVSFVPESHRLVQAYLQRFPPTDAELAEGFDAAPPADDDSADGADPTGLRRRRRWGAPLSAGRISQLHAQWQARQAGSNRGLARQRAALPTARLREEILGAVEGSQVVLVAGETGCGKTTQVPQFLLERAWGRGENCRVICTQPRRLSATSVAARVAAERGEAVGEDVGYITRLDSQVGAHTPLIFCTNGVLLRMLTQGDEGELDSLTHIVMDEVHERDRFADFLLIILKQLLPRKPRLRLVLMSATLHCELFAAYFGGCPVVQVPGFTHPVTDVYLDDILPMVGWSSAGQYKGNPAAAPGKPLPPLRPLPQLAADWQERLDEAISAAFASAFCASFSPGGDDAFAHLLQETGVASSADTAAAAEPGAAAQKGADDSLVDAPHSETGCTALMAAACKGDTGAVAALLAAGADPRRTAGDGSSAADWAARFGRSKVIPLLEQRAEAMQAAWEAGAAAAASASLLARYTRAGAADAVDLGLIVRLLEVLCKDDPAPGTAAASKEPPSAVLVFLPGWDEIARLREQLARHSRFGGAGCSVLALHSMVPSADQRRAFDRPLVGVRKIVLATNIAETAVTIEDVVVIINSGRMKEKSYDPYTAVSTLTSTWISQASEKQRRGRAGRCQPGVCFHLYSRQRSQSLAEFQEPELLRDPLDEVCLQVKLLEGRGFEFASVADFLGQALEPPPAAAIANALELLRDVGAVERGGEALTQLGRHLARLPLPPRTGKMLLLSLLFGVLDPLLTVACCMAYRSPWVLPIEAEARQAALAAKRRLAGESGGGSDHLALVQAYAGWEAAWWQWQDARFCEEHFLNGATLHTIWGMREQLLGKLRELGFVDSLAAASTHASDLGLVRSVLGAAFYPRTGVLLPLGGGGCFFRERSKRREDANRLLTAAAEQARVQPASLNCGHRPAGPTAVAFDERVRLDSQLCVMQTSLLPPHMLLLVGGRLEAVPGSHVDWETVYETETVQLSDSEDGLGWDSGFEDDGWEAGFSDSGSEGGYGGYRRGGGGGTVTRTVARQVAVPSSDRSLLLDGWLSVRLREHVQEPLRVLRRRLAACFAERIARPRQPPAESQQQLLALLTRVFGLEAAQLGFGGAAPQRPSPAPSSSNLQQSAEPQHAAAAGPQAELVAAMAGLQTGAGGRSLSHLARQFVPAAVPSPAAQPRPANGGARRG